MIRIEHPFELHEQTPAVACGPTTVAMQLSALGVRMTPEDVVDRAHAHKRRGDPGYTAPLGFAFTGGYSEALRVLVPGLPPSTAAASLLVVASVGEVDGKNRLRVARVPANAPGLRMHAASWPFIPAGRPRSRAI